MKSRNILGYYLFLSITMLLIASSCNNSSNDSQEAENSLETQIDTTVTVVEETTVDNASSLVETKDESKLNPAQLRVQKLLQSCVNGDYASAAKTIMYRGKDEARIGQDSFNYDNPGEANTVKVTCDVIDTWLGTAQSYEFISYNEEETDFGVQYVVEVMFKKEKLGFERHFFYFIDTPKGFLLINMV